MVMCIYYQITIIMLSEILFHYYSIASTVVYSQLNWHYLKPFRTLIWAVGINKEFEDHNGSWKCVICVKHVRMTDTRFCLYSNKCNNTMYVPGLPNMFTTYKSLTQCKFFYSLKGTTNRVSYYYICITVLA